VRSLPRERRDVRGGHVAVSVSLALCLAVGACRRSSAVNACAAPSSFEVLFVALNAGYTSQAAPDDPLAWRVEGRPFFCTQHITAVSVEQTEFGAELVLTPTEEGRRSLREATTGHLGEHVMVRIDGRPHSVAILQTPLGGKVFRLNMGSKLETDTEAFNARLRAELAHRTAH
jgi:hypothetical protein